MSAMPYEGKGYLQLVIGRMRETTFKHSLRVLFLREVGGGCFMRSEGERERERQGIWVAIVTAPQLRRVGKKKREIKNALARQPEVSLMPEY